MALHGPSSLKASPEREWHQIRAFRAVFGHLGLSTRLDRFRHVWDDGKGLSIDERCVEGEGGREAVLGLDAEAESGRKNKFRRLV